MSSLKEVIAQLESAKALTKSAVVAAKASAPKGQKLAYGQNAAQAANLAVAAATVKDCGALGFVPVSSRITVSKTGIATLNVAYRVPVTLAQRLETSLRSAEKRMVARFRRANGATTTGLTDDEVLVLAKAKAATASAPAASTRTTPEVTAPAIGSPEWIAAAVAALAAQQKAS